MVAKLLKPVPYAARLAGKRLRLLLVLGAVLVFGTFVVYLLAPPVVFDKDARQAIRQMGAGLRELKTLRERLGIPLDQNLDPVLSGLIGVDYTDLTTTLGDLRAKQTSLNPAFAGLLVQWLKQAGVPQGGSVALSFSGSFPALNLAALCACEALNLQPLIISSVGASSYGANIPGFTWLDMEAWLFERGIIRSRTSLASLGGILDTGGGIDEQGIVLGEAAIAKHGAVYLREGTTNNVSADVERRMRLYCARGTPAAFINVGGNVTSLGWVREAALLDNGLLSRVGSCASPRRGTIFRMAEAGVPVIHLINIERLAAANHLPVGALARQTGNPQQIDLTAARNNHLRQLGLLLLTWLVFATLAAGCGLLAFRR